MRSWRRNYKPLLKSVLILEGKSVYKVFNDRLSIPLSWMRTAQLRNLRSFDQQPDPDPKAQFRVEVGALRP